MDMNNTTTNIAAATPAEVGPAAARLSADNPGMYVVVTVDFSTVTARITRRLHVNSPSDAWGDSYWLNGKAKRFSAKQWAADWAATPTMA